MQQPLFSCGTSYSDHGKVASTAIAENLDSFLSVAHSLGWEQRKLEEMSKHYISTMDERTLKNVKEISKGSGTPFDLMLCYNLMHGSFMPEGCTVYFAAGKAAKSGKTIFGKNSDKGGSTDLLGENCYEYREINAVVCFENLDGSYVVGVSAAGTTGFKMALNSYGVAAATNFANTRAILNKKLSRSDLFAGDRAQIIRDALTMPTALGAAQFAVERLMKKPMATSGMVEFADSTSVYIVEATYDCLAVKQVVDDVDSRSNYFVTLDNLNEPGDASCFCRYHRTQHLLREKYGSVSLQDMKDISCSHHDGTGSVGICRHTPGLASSTLAAAIMELDGVNSKIHIALGKPCNAWRRADGNVSIEIKNGISGISNDFLDGTAFKKYCLALPTEK